MSYLVINVRTQKVNVICQNKLTSWKIGRFILNTYCFH